jgi:hypothetical protein
MAVPTSAVSELNALERDVLTVLALTDEPWLSRTGWKEKASQAGIVDPRGRQITGEAFHDLVRALTAKGGAVAVDGRGYVVHMTWLAPVLDDAERRGQLRPLAERLTRHTRHGYGGRHGRVGVVPDLRVALASGRAEDLKAAEETFANHERVYGARAVTTLAALGLDIPAEWVARLEERRRAKYLEHACQLAFVAACALGAGLRSAIVESGRPELRARLATLLALEGNVASARELLGAGTTAWERGATAFLAYVEGHHSKARELFAAAAVGSRKQRVELPSYLAVFDTLLAATSDDVGLVTEVPARLTRAKSQFKFHAAAAYALEEIAAFRAAGAKPDALLYGRCDSWIDLLVGRLAVA